MDVFDIKVEKAKAILKYRRLQKITALFRFMEVCIFLFIILSISTQFPFSFKLPGDFFHGISITIFSPGFIFILGNAIVLVLFLKYGQFSAQENRNHNNSVDFSNGYVQSWEKKMNINHTEEIKKRGKQSMYEEIKSLSDLGIFEDPNLGIFEDRKMHKSHSEDFKRYQHEYSHRKLRRSMTERCREKVYSYAEDEMSGDEFRRTVEAFIARQQRSLREEEDFSAIVTFEHN